MKDKTITIEIDLDGTSSIDLDQFQGKGCSKVVKDFRGGDTVLSTRNKREYAIEPAQTVKVTQ